MNEFLIAIHDPIVIATAFTLLGSLISVFATLATTRYENRRHIRDVGVKLALAHFESRVKEQQALADATGKMREVNALPVFFAEAMKVAEIVSNPKLNGFDIGWRLAELPRFVVEIQRGVNAGIKGQHG